jgi:hypothetical protein
MPRIGQSNIDVFVRTKSDTKGFQDTEKAASGLGGKLVKFGALAAAAVGAVAAGAIIKFGKESLRVFAEEEAINKKLTQLVLNQKDATMANVQALMAQADALENTGVISAGSIKMGQAQLQMFDLQTDSIMKLTPALLDMAVAEVGVNATQEDLQRLANGLGKAMQGQMDILRKMGFTFTDAQAEMLKTATEEERLAFITDLVSSTYADMNAAMRDTFEGQMAVARNNMDKFKEKIGELLSKAAVPFLKIFNENIIPTLQRLASWIANNVVPVLLRLRDAFVINVLPILQTVWSFVKDQFIAAWERLRQIVEPHKEEFKKLAMVLGVILLVPLGLVAAAIGGLIVALSLLARGIASAISWVVRIGDWFTNLQVKTATAFSNIHRTITDTIGNAMSRAWSFVTSIGGNIIGWFMSLPGRIASAVRGIAATAFNPMLEKLNRLPGIDIPLLAHGVKNFRGGLAVVGERGPELVNLPRGSDVIPNSQLAQNSGGIVVNQTNNIYRETDMLAVMRELGFQLRTAV